MRRTNRRLTRQIQKILAVFGLTALLMQMGCVVTQPRGEGDMMRVVEPTTKRAYWLYLPEDYKKADDVGRAARTWPTVVTFHGLRPFDDGNPQNREWQQEADRYGFVVVAPELRSASVFSEFPLRTVHGGLQADEQATLAILDQVFRTTRASRKYVLSTGFSSGGYMAHYMVNRHPDVFSAIATRQANFSKAIMDEQRAKLTRDYPILVVNTRNDVAICKRESAEAVNFYQDTGHRKVFWVHLKNGGHARMPDLAAAFFAKTAGVSPKYPPETLAKRQAVDGNAEGLAFLAGDDVGLDSRSGMSISPRRSAASRRRPDVRSDKTGVEMAPVKQMVNIGIDLSSAIDIQPLHLSYSATSIPQSWRRTAKFIWTLNGKTIGRQVNGHKTISQPGEYTLKLVVVANDGKRHQATRSIRVLPKAELATQ